MQDYADAAASLNLFLVIYLRSSPIHFSFVQGFRCTLDFDNWERESHRGVRGMVHRRED